MQFGKSGTDLGSSVAVCARDRPVGDARMGCLGPGSHLGGVEGGGGVRHGFRSVTFVRTRAGRCGRRKGGHESSFGSAVHASDGSVSFVGFPRQTFPSLPTRALALHPPPRCRTSTSGTTPPSSGRIHRRFRLCTCPGCNRRKSLRRPIWPSRSQSMEFSDPAESCTGPRGTRRSLPACHSGTTHRWPRRRDCDPRDNLCRQTRWRRWKICLPRRPCKRLPQRATQPPHVAARDLGVL